MQTLTLIRGLPGSGKSTLAKALGDELSEWGSVWRWYEADMWFLDEHGNYNFDGSQLGLAHKWCQSQTRNSLTLLGHNVIVSNTFTTLKEIQPYLDMIRDRPEIHLQIIGCYGNFGNIHGVPVEVIDKMANRWEEIYPDFVDDFNRRDGDFNYVEARS